MPRIPAHSGPKQRNIGQPALLHPTVLQLGFTELLNNVLFILHAPSVNTHGNQFEVKEKKVNLTFLEIYFLFLVTKYLWTRLAFLGLEFLHG